MKILVIMPTYNQEDRIEYAVKSILNQTYKNWHLVIVDDHSTDNTPSILEKYSENKKITIIRNNENRGCYYSRNMGFKTALQIGYDWDVHTVHDSDDVSSPIRFEMGIKPFINDGVKLLTTRYLRTTDQLKRYDSKCYVERNSLGLGIGFYAREIFQGIGYYDDTRFGGDSEYYERAQMYCDRKDYRTGQFDSIALYIAVYHRNNLTITVNGNERSVYAVKYKSEHQQMKKKGSFYRGFNPSFRHIIVTRFNIPFGETDISNDIEYTRYRISLIQKFLINSLKSQTSRNFDFYILCRFGKDTRDLILTGLSDNIVKIFEWSNHRKFTEYIKRIYRDYDFIMESRIDSDDFYADDFVETVQKRFKEMKQVIDCRNYVQFDCRSNHWNNPYINSWSSPFVTVVQPLGSYDTIMNVNHGKWIKMDEYDYIDLNGHHAVQVIHGGNVSNRMETTRCISDAFLKKVPFIS